jgi:RNA polymerase sigma-70 factor (ECF subfamily)
MRESVAAEVVRRASEGDRSAEAELYGAYRERLRAYFWTHGTTPPDVDDLVHETITAALKALRTRKDTIANFEGWLFRTARNLRVSEIRRRSRARSEPIEAAAPRVASDSTDVEREERRRLLWEGIGKLPRKYRVPLELRINGLSYKQIAEKLGSSVSTVGVWLYRARRMLADRLAPN